MQLLGSVVNTVFFCQGWERSRFALYSWCFQHNIGERCKGDALFMDARLWEKGRGVMKRKITVKCPLQSPYFFNCCSVLFLPWHLPKQLSKIIDMLEASEKKIWPVLSDERSPNTAVIERVDIWYLLCPLICWWGSQVKWGPQWPAIPEQYSQLWKLHFLCPLDKLLFLSILISTLFFKC